MTLRIENVTKEYGNGVKALNGVNIEIPNGMFGLLGPNGAGKSSLMRTLATLQTPTTGDINLNDIDLLKNSAAIRSQLGYLPQEFGVPDGMSAEQLLDHIAAIKGIACKTERAAVVASLLHQTNLFDARKRAVSSYSGGMRQRFGIAQALIGNPKIIIVDEPTAGLDPEERNRFHNILCELGEDRIVILSTHIVEDVLSLCPEMAILCAGKILFQGSPESCIAAVKGQIWRKSISKDTFDDYAKSLSIISSHTFKGMLEIRVFSETNPGMGFEAAEPNLEDAYFKITKFEA